MSNKIIDEDRCGRGSIMAEAVGFFTDTTICIGCKACEVACHQWNALPARQGGAVPLSGLSYDNTVWAFASPGKKESLPDTARNGELKAA